MGRDTKILLRRPFETLQAETRDILILGCAGLLEIKHFVPQSLVNAFVEATKKKNPADVALVNAVLRKIASDGREKLEELKIAQTK